MVLSLAGRLPSATPKAASISPPKDGSIDMLVPSLSLALEEVKIVLYMIRGKLSSKARIKEERWKMLSWLLKKLEVVK